MSEGTLPPFLFDGESIVRVVIIDEEPWFVASDVCRALGLANPTEVVRGLEEDEKRLSTTETKRDNREVVVVSESGLYVLIFKSRKEEATRFRRWITSEVLPSIRRTGVYIPESAIIVRKPYSEWSAEEWRLKLATVNTARKTLSLAAAAWMWEHEGFPIPPRRLLPSWWQDNLLG